METTTQIEKLKEEYNCLLQELEILRKKHAILDGEHKAIISNIDALDNKIDAIESEMTNITDYIKEEEKKYIENKEIEIVRLSMIISTISASTFGRLSFRSEESLADCFVNAFISAFIYYVGSSIIVPVILLNKKINNIFKNNFRKTEIYSKYKVLFSEKEYEVTKLKIEKKSAEWDCYQSYEVVCNLNQLIINKEAEIEEFKKKVYSLLFEDTKEETLPLVKKRKRD